MGKKDTITKEYLADPKIFADAFNYFIFDGKKVIKHRDLQEQDPTEIAVVDKRGRTFMDQKMRDLLKKCTIRYYKQATLVLLGIEAAAGINYAMPARDNFYDALNYMGQIDAIRKRHKEAGDLKDGPEFISGLAKDDRLVPVITLCVCFDKSKWDGPRSLHDMFGKMDPRIKKYVNNYELNLITPDEIRDFSKFSSELGVVLEFIQNSDDKKKLRDIIEKEERYKGVDVRTVDIINTYTNANISKKDAKGGRLNMCTALQGIMEDCRTEGREVGRKEGHKEGREVGRREGHKEGRKEGIQAGENRLASLLKLLKPDSKEYDRALNGTSAQRNRLYKKYNIA